MTEKEQPGDLYIKRAYRQIIMLALAAHLSYILIFWQLGNAVLAAYNVASVLFYGAMLKAVQKGYFRLTVNCIHVEVCIFVIVCTRNAGWETGISLYLIAMTSLTYFCPYEHKYIPYLFAVTELSLFLALKLYMDLVCPAYQAVPESVRLWLYLYNACACFTIIIYAAFSSKVSASVSRKELQDENRSLSELANYDQLTGLLSRHAFQEKLKALQGGLVVVALSDIDDFKKVNDVWGHICGDRVLRESAELIRRFLGGNVDVCRWGGEEFLFLFRDTDMKTAVEILNRLCKAIGEYPFYCEGTEFHITMTFGVSSGMAGISMDELVAMADRCMYEGKAGGKNRVVYSRGQ